MPIIISRDTIISLRHSFATHGLLHVIVSDKGTSFTSNEFKTFCTMNGIRHITTAPYHSSPNDPAKQAVLMFESSMKIICKSSSSDLVTSVNRFFLKYRSIPHSFTSLSLAITSPRD